MAGAAQGVTPVQFGSISRIGSSIYGMAPGPAEPLRADLETAWASWPARLRRVPAPSPSRPTERRSFAATVTRTPAATPALAPSTPSSRVRTGRNPVLGTPVHEATSRSSITHDHETVAEIDQVEPRLDGGTRRKRLDSPPQPDDGCARVASIRSRYPPRRDDAGRAGHAGNWYRWWIACYQYVGVATPGLRSRTSRSTSGRCFRLHPGARPFGSARFTPTAAGAGDAHPDAFRTISVGSWSASSSFTAKPAASCRPAGSCRLPASSAPRPGRRRIGRRPVFQLEPVGESHSVLLRQSAGTERPP